jgi:NSS family neurotransmitter:Na+ symporter
VVIGGVQSGIERWSRILMPALFTTLIGLAIYALTLDGAGQAMGFLFGMHTDKLAATGALEALGQAFFSLSLGMGAMLTYGSYLPKETSIFRSALWVAGLDTLVALLAGAVIFPVTFTYGISPSEGPGLVFQSLPVAFSKMPGGHILAIIFFSLLIFAALTSSISLLEVVASTAIDLWGWTRKKAVAVMGAIIFIVGIPSALSGGDLFGNGLKSLIGLSFFDLMYKSSANYMLPLGGMLIALYVGWAIDKKTCEQEMDSEKMGGIYGVWKVLLQFVAPLAVLLVMANSTGLIKAIIGEKK